MLTTPPDAEDIMPPYMEDIPKMLIPSPILKKLCLGRTIVEKPPPVSLVPLISIIEKLGSVCFAVPSFRGYSKPRSFMDLSAKVCVTTFGPPEIPIAFIERSSNCVQADELTVRK
tara:strand:+ start:3366 stop:3710 length:345 start_codon:yes stop_codon:yes gene_type:complete